MLRAQAARKQAFEQVLPILTDGFIRPKTEQRPAGKQRAAIKEALSTLQHNLEEEETSFVALQNVVEHCCNFFFAHDRFPWTYEELQPVPLLKVGMLTYAGDDGREKGQAYRLALDLDGGVARFRFRYPDEAGVWSLAQRGHDHPFARGCLRTSQRGGVDGSHPARRAPSGWFTHGGARLHR